MTTEMLSIRVPAATASQVKALAAARQVTVSDLLRAAVEGLLTGQAAILPSNPQELRLSALEHALSHVVTRLDALEEYTRQTAAASDALDMSDRALSDRDDVLDISNTIELSDDDNVSDEQRVLPEETAQAQHYLGKVCPAGHDYQGTGQSLRSRANGGCLECMKLQARARRARRRGASPST